MKHVAIVAILAGTAHADDRAKVDWARGMVIAGGIGVADRHAPNPAVARGTSRRGAEDAAKRALAVAVRDLPLAGGGTVGDRAARATDVAIVLDAEPETDGAWHVTMAVPIEAVRQAIAGPRALPDGGDTGPAVVVVDGATAKPAVGWSIVAPGGALDAATLWVKDVPAWAKDAPRATAKRVKGGAIEVDGMTATAATLFVIVGKS